MNWKLILQLSLFGLAMAIATVFWIPSKVEPLFWILIFLFCAYSIGKNAAGQYFLNGLMLGLLNCVWITSAHILLADQYLANHAQEAAMMKSMPMGDNLRLAMATFGPVVGVVSGILIGLLAWIASKLVGAKSAAASAR